MGKEPILTNPLIFILILISLGSSFYSHAGLSNISPTTGETVPSLHRKESILSPALPVLSTETPSLIAGGLYGTDGQNLYLIDKSNGNATLIGSHGTVEYKIGALAFSPNGILYGVSCTADSQLYKIDPSTGATSAVGPLGVGYIFEAGLTFDEENRLLGTNQGNANDAKMFVIDHSTGAATVVGPDPGEIRDINGLAFDGSTLYAIDRVSNTYGTFDPDTGSYTAIGNPSVIIGETGGGGYRSGRR